MCRRGNHGISGASQHAFIRVAKPDISGAHGLRKGLPPPKGAHCKGVTAMLRVAVCDDTLDELQSLALLTNQYISANILDAEVMEFSRRTVCGYLSHWISPAVNAAARLSSSA